MYSSPLTNFVKRSFVAVALGLGAGAVAQAQPDITKTWNGATPSWGTGSNWSPTGIPSSSDVAGFTGSGFTTVSLGGATRIVEAVGFTGATSYNLTNGTLQLNGSTQTGQTGYGLFSSATAGQSIASTVTVSVNHANQQWNITGSPVTVNGVITDGGNGINKTGGGVLVLSGANTYSGTIDVDGGTLRLGANDSFSAGGTINLSTGATLDVNGNSDSDAGTLTFDGNSTLSLAAGDTTQNIFFDDIAQLSGFLSITGWSGPLGGAGTAGRIFVRENVVDPTTLGSINFSGFTSGAGLIDSSFAGYDELVPAPEPATTLAVAGLGLFGLRAVRRRLAKPVEPVSA